jgi:hypothetical protein
MGVAREVSLEEQHPAGTFRLTPEEVDELDQADAELDEDERAGKIRPIAELLAKIDQLERS